MPIYTYRREDDSRFDVKQAFHEDPLEFCPDSGQRVVRVVQPVGIVFKGSGFYVNDSKAVKSSGGAAPSENGQSPVGEAKKDDGVDKADGKDSAKTEAKTDGEKPAKSAKKEPNRVAAAG